MAAWPFSGFAIIVSVNTQRPDSDRKAGFQQSRIFTAYLLIRQPISALAFFGMSTCLLEYYVCTACCLAKQWSFFRKYFALQKTLSLTVPICFYLHRWSIDITTPFLHSISTAAPFQPCHCLLYKCGHHPHTLLTYHGTFHRANPGDSIAKNHMKIGW